MAMMNGLVRIAEQCTKMKKKLTTAVIMKGQKKMNQIELQRKRNETSRLVRFSNRKPHGLYWGTGETDAHIQMKLEICKWLKRQGKEFMTESIFENGLRADVLNLDDAIAYEVMESESMESIKKKVDDYPVDVIWVQARQPFNEKLIL